MPGEDATQTQLHSELVALRQEVAALQAQLATYRHTQDVLAEKTRLLLLSAEIGTALAGSEALRAVLQRCAEAMAQHLQAVLVRIWTLEAEDDKLVLQANAGTYAHLDGAPAQVAPSDCALGLIVRSRVPRVLHTALGLVQSLHHNGQRHSQIGTSAGYPLIVEDRLIGVMTLCVPRPLSQATQEVLSWIASSIAVGIDRIRIGDALAQSITKVVRMNKSLRRKNAELDEFTYIASHDLQEPLRQLTAFSSMLRRDLGGDLPARAAQDLEFIVEAATRMQTLVQKLLELSRTGNAALKWEWLALDACVDHALDILAPYIHATDATIIRDALPEVWGDRTMLTQLYVNLLSNALKFHGEHKPVIHITAEQQGKQWVFGVRDNGIGIKADYHEQIFAPFKRLHGRSTYAGAGIGLTICRKAVERHGGRIWVESTVGVGSHFRFTLENPLTCGDELPE